MVSRASLQLWHRVSVTFLKVRCWVAGVVAQRSQVNDWFSCLGGWFGGGTIVCHPLLFRVLEDCEYSTLWGAREYCVRGVL